MESAYAATTPRTTALAGPCLPFVSNRGDSEINPGDNEHPLGHNERARGDNAAPLGHNARVP